METKALIPASPGAGTDYSTFTSHTENKFQAFPEPSAPPIQDLVGGVNLHVGYAEPPPSYNATLSEEKLWVEEKFASPMHLEERDVREALSTFVSSHCCYGKSFAKDSEISDLSLSHAYLYKLESFCETRKVEKVIIPFIGGPVDGPMNGPVPDLWSISVPLPDMFVDKMLSVEIPHTSFVVPCRKCQSKGFSICLGCNEKGKIFCTGCCGTGKRNQRSPESCFSCSGQGYIDCHLCGGPGRVHCIDCNGECRLKVSHVMEVKWTTHTKTQLIGVDPDLESTCERVATVRLLAQQCYRVQPIKQFIDQRVVDVSQHCYLDHLYLDHRQGSSNSVMHVQRQSVDAFPVHSVTCSWRGKLYHLSLVGEDHHVHFPNYPEKCCWGACVIL